jgi:hypothetical protein
MNPPPLSPPLSPLKKKSPRVETSPATGKLPTAKKGSSEAPTKISQTPKGKPASKGTPKAQPTPQKPPVTPKPVGKTPRVTQEQEKPVARSPHCNVSPKTTGAPTRKT